MTQNRPLTGCLVGISISESEEMELLGFDRSEVNRTVVRLSESLLGAGARLAFGHDWRPGGVMEAVATLALRYHGVRPNAKGDFAGGAPILNIVAWPDIPFLQQLENDKGNPMAQMLRGIVDARQSPSDQAVTLRTEALTKMREELAEQCDVRICLGGKLTGFEGKYPGIIEEALCSMDRGKPVIASAIFGGAAAVIIQGLSQGKFGVPHFFKPDPRIKEWEEEIRNRAFIDSVSKEFLSKTKDTHLWESTSIEQCTERILRGAIHWWLERKQ